MVLSLIIGKSTPVNMLKPKIFTVVLNGLFWSRLYLKRTWFFADPVSLQLKLPIQATEDEVKEKFSEVKGKENRKIRTLRSNPKEDEYYPAQESVNENS